MSSSSMVVPAAPCQNVAVTLASPVPVRVQLCGAIVVEQAGERLESRLPGRQGRLLFAYLVLNRHRQVSRDELVDALWAGQPPAAIDAALNPLISKLRKGIGSAAVEGRTGVRLRLADDAWVDVEVAEDAVHRAESRVAQQQWEPAWAPSLTGLFIAEREFLSGEDAPWIDERRLRMADLRLRALEAYGAATLGTGGTELPAAIRAGRELTRLAPLRESGYQLLMRALAAKGDVAQALGVHADLCRTLRDELGVSPSPATQIVFESLLGR
jgi:SARP family transcriptional regulator, regulator of embCAB operon